MEDQLSGRAECRGDFLAFQVGELVDAGVPAAEYLAAPFDDVWQNDDALAAGRKIVRHASGGEYVETTAHQRGKTFDARVEARELGRQPLLRVKVHFLHQPHLPIARRNVDIADADRLCCLRIDVLRQCAGKGDRAERRQRFECVTA